MYGTVSARYGTTRCPVRFGSVRYGTTRYPVRFGTVDASKGKATFPVMTREDTWGTLKISQDHTGRCGHMRLESGRPGRARPHKPKQLTHTQKTHTERHTHNGKLLSPQVEHTLLLTRMYVRTSTDTEKKLPCPPPAIKTRKKTARPEPPKPLYPPEPSAGARPRS